MSNKEGITTPNRREFLKGAGIAVASAVGGGYSAHQYDKVDKEIHDAVTTVNHDEQQKLVYQMCREITRPENCEALKPDLPNTLEIMQKISLDQNRRTVWGYTALFSMVPFTYGLVKALRALDSSDKKSG